MGVTTCLKGLEAWRAATRLDRCTWLTRPHSSVPQTPWTRHGVGPRVLENTVGIAYTHGDSRALA